MTKLAGTIAVAMALALPAMASAQTKMTDVEYCKALGDKYRTYVANPQSGRSPMPDPAEVQNAIDQCAKGNTAAGIPVLERRLKNARIDLPPRG